MTRILFVCMGNICRSPAAEGLFRHLLRQEAPEWLERIEIDSAGTHGYHIGRPPDPRMMAAALARGIDLSGLRARLVQAEDFATFTHILVMDRANLAHLQAIQPHGATAIPELLLAPLDDGRLQEVPDPYYGGPQGFDRVLDLLEEGCRRLLAHVRDKPPQT
ncbi:MAG TPA: low molecular weight protein-tyrosine-phosphatase [Candidatus Macondimonas sp.]|nr:low molecular weight protein-tyrosine-phosphatase [Candidatus Macondimonas sp.]